MGLRMHGEDEHDMKVSESRKREESVPWDELRSEYSPELIRSGVRGKYISSEKRKGGKPRAGRRQLTARKPDACAMTVSKDDVFDSLPMRAGDITIRLWEREDMDRFAEWPLYPLEFDAFNEAFILRFRRMSPEQREEHFQLREGRIDRLDITADCPDEPAVGYLALVEIDWAGGVIGNMSYRVHPLWCDKGIGTRIMRTVAEWCFEHGFRTLRLDVAASNARAVRCYEKAGFVQTGEFWQDDPWLKTIDIADPKYDFLRPHVRFERDTPQTRFLWMEMRNG